MTTFAIIYVVGVLTILFAFMCAGKRGDTPDDLSDQIAHGDVVAVPTVKNPFVHASPFASEGQPYHDAQ